MYRLKTDPVHCTGCFRIVNKMFTHFFTGMLLYMLQNISKLICARSLLTFYSSFCTTPWSGAFVELGGWGCSKREGKKNGGVKSEKDSMN